MILIGQQLDHRKSGTSAQDLEQQADRDVVSADTVTTDIQRWYNLADHCDDQRRDAGYRLRPVSAVFCHQHF